MRNVRSFLAIVWVSWAALGSGADTVAASDTLSQPARRPEATVEGTFPRRFEHVKLEGILLPRNGTLLVTADELVFDDGKAPLHIPGSELLRVSVNPLAVSKLNVEYREGDRTRLLTFVMQRSFREVFRPWSSVAVNDAKASIQELIERTPPVGDATTNGRRSSRTPGGIHIGVAAGLAMFAGRDDSLEYFRIGGLAVAAGLGGFIGPRFAVGLRIESMFAVLGGDFILPVDGFAGADFQYWQGRDWMIGCAVGAAGSVPAGRSGVGVPLRVGYRPGASGANVDMVGIEVFPIFLRDHTAWTVGLVAETTFLKQPSRKNRKL